MPGDSRKLLSLSEIRRPCWDSLTPATGSGRKGIPRADHTHEKCSGTFSVICTPFSFLGREFADHVHSSRPELLACVPGSERLHGDRRDRFLRLVFLGCSSDGLFPPPTPGPRHTGGRDRKRALDKASLGGGALEQLQPELAGSCSSKLSFWNEMNMELWAPVR